MKQLFLRMISVLSSALLAAAAAPMNAAAETSDIFCDDFSGTQLDTGKWLIAEKNWGGTVTENGRTVDYNGGVLAENAAVRNGSLLLTGYGSCYEGAVRGINRDGSTRADGKRCGAAIATKDYFGSGSYEIRAKIAPELGCCSAMWTFEYEEDYSGDTLTVTNHEIDIEIPGRDRNNGFSLSHALCTTWQTEEDYKTESVECGAQADGAFHTYRFDWHTGSDTETPRVEYYFDGKLTYTATEYIPTNAGRFWLGLWFPKNWAGTPDFDTTVFEIDYAKITPFHEAGDTPQHESYPDSGWAEPVPALPEGWLLWHSYSAYSALDSRLYLRSPDGQTREITGDFISAMNGSFGRSPDEFVFMALNSTGDEWDIFLYENGEIRNLTQNSGYRNEDPKWSPDGNSIVFKRGHWDSTADDFRYHLALLDLSDGSVTALTDEAAERAMPCFSSDGSALYYAEYKNGFGSICRMDPETKKSETIYSENGVTAYYPVSYGDDIYFTKWYSSENHCDQIMRFDGAKITAMPFDSVDYDCSDACPLEGGMVYSSTQHGTYDLYYFDGTRSACLRALSTEQNDLGAAFFQMLSGDINADGRRDAADVTALRNWLSGEPEPDVINPGAADLNRDGRLNAADLTLLKRMLVNT